MGLEHVAVGEFGLAWHHAGGVGGHIALGVEQQDVAAYRRGEGLVEVDLLAQFGRERLQVRLLRRLDQAEQ
ncbi:hypothetical protein D3C80_1740640 [compost metagenome]